MKDFCCERKKERGEEEEQSHLPARVLNEAHSCASCRGTKRSKFQHPSLEAVLREGFLMDGLVQAQSLISKVQEVTSQKEQKPSF